MRLGGWAYFRRILNVFWTYFECILGVFWVHFECIFDGMNSIFKFRFLDLLETSRNSCQNGPKRIPGCPQSRPMFLFVFDVF